jgi:peptide deformylase
LAAPQIGESLSIFVIDVTHEKANPKPVVFINPKIIKKSGAISSLEGCLSFPDVFTEVRRYSNVTVKAQDGNGKPFIIEAEGGSLLAKALQHEYDHLNGVVFIDHARNRFEVDELLHQQDLPPIEAEKLLDESELEEEIQKAEVQAKEVLSAEKE